MTSSPSVSIVSLGCSRNDVDSEELAGRLNADGWNLVDEDSPADVILVNTCGFIAQAKQDSINTLIEAAEAQGNTGKVVAVGCMAQRYGKELAEQLPEAAAVLGFDHYPTIGSTLRRIMAGEVVESHIPSDRRLSLPTTPVSRPEVADSVAIPGMGPHVYRGRLNQAPWAPLKIASGCDRRCSFCSIPSFRGSFISRNPLDVIEEATWLGAHGVRELLLVSENSTSYGKDLGDLRSLERLLPALTLLDGIEWVRVSYLQPAEMRPELLAIIAGTQGVVPYFDLSFQHASADILRRMRRFGDLDSFLTLISKIRELNPHAGIRSNVIVGFPGETQQDLDTLAEFIEQAQLDVLGVFGYSNEEGTTAFTLPDQLPEHEIESRVDYVSSLSTRVSDEVATGRIGQRVRVLIESSDGEGRSEHQGPEVDGITTIIDYSDLTVGDIVEALVCDAQGIDLIAQVME